MKPEEQTREPSHPAAITLLGLAVLVALHAFAYFSRGKLEISIFIAVTILTCTWLGGFRSGVILALIAAIDTFALEALLHSVSHFTAFDWINPPVIALLGCALAWAAQSVRDQLLTAQTQASQQKLELQQQASERQRTERDLRASEQRFRQLNENIKEVFWITNVEKTEMIYISPGYESIWGQTCQSLYDNPRSWLEAIHPEDRENVVSAAMKQQSGHYDEQYRVIRPDGTVRWVRDRGFPVYDENGAVYRIAGVADDITVQKEAEQALATQEERFHRFLDNSAMIAFIKDEQGRFQYVNPTLQKRYSYSLIGKTVFDVHPPEVAGRLHEKDLAVLASSTTIEFTDTIPFPDGTITDWINYKFPFKDSSGRRYVGCVALEITHQRRLEKQLLEVSDREQARIGHDLHDELCQFLVGVLFHCHDLSDALEANGSSEAERARRIAELIDSAISQARQLARGLFPVLLEQEGLVPALQELALGVKGRFKTDCSVECSTAVSVKKKPVANHLYRIAQEAVNNAARHGHARHIKIRLGTSNSTFNLAVTDDGTGFEYADGARGMGLHIMNYRAHSIGAALEISSPPESGTTIVCRVPIEKL